MSALPRRKPIIPPIFCTRRLWKFFSRPAARSPRPSTWWWCRSTAGSSAPRRPAARSPRPRPGGGASPPPAAAHAGPQLDHQALDQVVVQIHCQQRTTPACSSITTASTWWWCRSTAGSGPRRPAARSPRPRPGGGADLPPAAAHAGPQLDHQALDLVVMQVHRRQRLTPACSSITTASNTLQM